MRSRAVPPEAVARTRRQVEECRRLRALYADRVDTVAHSKGEYVRGGVLTNSIESVWAVLKRSIRGTWHHVSPKHLERYVNEAAFRLNEGDCEVDAIVRMEAFAARIGGKRLAYNDLVR